MIIPVLDTYLQVRVLRDINGVRRVVRNREQLRSLSTSRHIITNPGSMSDIVISKCLRAHYLYEAFRAGFTGRGAIMQATRLPGSSAGERKL